MYFQLPTTPTPMPAGVAVADLSSYSIWNSTDSAIQTWNWLGDSGSVIQGIIIIALVVAGMFVVYKFVQQFIRRDAEL